MRQFHKTKIYNGIGQGLHNITLKLTQNDDD